MGDLGAFISSLVDFRAQVDWLGVIDPNPDPVIFMPDHIRLANTDGTFTDFFGHDFDISGNGPSGTLTSIELVASDELTVIETVPVDASLEFGAAALFGDNAGQQFYELAGTGDNTLQGFTPFVTDTNFIYSNLESTAGHDTIIGEPFSFDPEDANRPCQLGELR